MAESSVNAMTLAEGLLKQARGDGKLAMAEVDASIDVFFTKFMENASDEERDNLLKEARGIIDAEQLEAVKAKKEKASNNLSLIATSIARKIKG